MEQIDFEKYIGLPLELAKQDLEKQGIKVEEKEFSKPKIRKSDMLVVKVEKLGEKHVLLLVADFKIEL